MIGSMEFDAFASGQIGSKIWLCEHLENAVATLEIRDPVVWLLGGWYGLTGFLLHTRARAGIRHVRSFDIDPACEPIADLINNNWVWRDWKFKAFTQDCRELDFENVAGFGPVPDVIINTSIEHFHGDQWWERIPAGRLVALQSCDMPHDDHHVLVRSADELARRFPMKKTLFTGELEFPYATWSFRRFMTIGVK